MADLNLSGVGVALVTPFNKDFSIDYDALKKLLDHIVSGDADYIVALGTTAETPTLTKEEKIILADFIRHNTPAEMPLVIGVGGNNTKALCEELAAGNYEGYSAVLSVTPYYNKPSQEGLFRHYQAVADASPLPIVLYNVPNRTGVNLTARTTLRLASEVEGIIAIKEASGNLAQISEIIREAPEGFSVISGDDSAIAGIMQAGGIGVISVLANALPREVKAIVNECEAGNFEEAFSRQAKLKDLLTPLFEEGNPSGIKTLLSAMGLTDDTLRLPLVNVSDPVAHKIHKALLALQSVG